MLRNRRLLNHRLPIHRLQIHSLPQSHSRVSGRDEAKSGARLAAIHLRLKHLSADERYEQLREFAFPDEQVDARCAIGFCNVAFPPTAFARALGKRPRPGFFSPPNVNGVDGVFCSAWELVQAATEVGRIHEITQWVSEHHGANTEYLGLIVRLSGKRGIDEQASSEWFDRLIERVQTGDARSRRQAAVIAILTASSKDHSGWSEQLDRAIGVSNASDPATRYARSAFLRAQLSSADHAFRLNQDWVSIAGDGDWFADGNDLTHWSGQASKLCIDFQYRAISSLNWSTVVLTHNHSWLSTTGISPS